MMGSLRELYSWQSKSVVNQLCNYCSSNSVNARKVLEKVTCGILKRGYEVRASLKLTLNYTTAYLQRQLFHICMGEKNKHVTLIT